MGGELRGSEQAETVKPTSVDGRQAWKLYMPAGSAALVVIKREW